MRCVVTGGAGFIGGYIARHLLSVGDDVVIYDIATPDTDLFDHDGVSVVHGSVLDWPMLCASMKGADEVYNCAAVLGTSELLSTAHRAVNVNILGTLNVLDAARLMGVKKVFNPTKPNAWRNVYTITKYAAEELTLMYYEQYGLCATSLRWFNAYGPRQHHWPVRKVLPTFVMCALTGRPLTVYGTGEQTVDMIYVGDIARIAVDFTRHCLSLGKTVDVGLGVALTVNDLAATIAVLGGEGSLVLHIPMRAGEPTEASIVADASVLSSLYAPSIAARPFVTLSDGLRRTVQWYRDHLPIDEMNRTLDLYNVPLRRE